MSSGKLTIEEISDGRYRLLMSLDIELPSGLTCNQIVASSICNESQLNANDKRHQKDTKTLLSIAEVGEELGISRTKAYELIWSGQLESIKIGRLRRVPATCVKEYIDRLLSADR